MALALIPARRPVALVCVGMRERIELLGGRLRVTGLYGEGTRIEALLPTTACAGAASSTPGLGYDGLHPVPALQESER